MFDFDITLQAPPDKPVVFGDSKEGTMATRVAETMRLKHKEGRARGTLSCPPDCAMERLGENGPIGVIITVPWPADPTAWKHSASPFSIILTIPAIPRPGMCATTAFSRPTHSACMISKKKPKGAGDMTIAAGQSVTFRYRFYYHRGDEKQAQGGRTLPAIRRGKQPPD
jgi:hypothetical protein